MSEVMELACGYDRRKKPDTAKWRFMTVWEAKKLSAGMRVPFLANDGTQRELTINGEPKTWKRKYPGVSIPVKYGMYEYHTIDCREDMGGDPCKPLLEEVR